LSTRTGKPKKYCSKKCSNKFYRNEERYYKKKHADWGTRGEKERQRKLKAQKEFEWYSTNWLTAAQIAKEIGITFHAVHQRAKKRGLKPTIRAAGSGRVAPTAFFSPEEAEIIKQPYIAKPVPIPEGYMTRQEFEVAIGVGSWCMPKRYGVESCLRHKTYSASGAPTTLTLWHESKVDLYFQRKAAHKKAVQEKRLAKRLAKEAELQRARGERAALIGDRLHSAAAALYVGCADQTLRKADVPHKLAYDRRFYLIQDLDAYKERREAVKAELAEHRAARRKKYNRRGRPRRVDNWTSTEAYEKRLFASFSHKLTSFKKKYGADSSKHNSLAHAIGANEELVRLASTGTLKYFTCKACAVSRPYHDFYFEASSPLGRRTAQCKDCNKKKRRAKRKQSNSGVYKKPESPEQKFRRLLGAVIKQEISKHRDAYATDLSIQSIWDSLPYTAKELTEHLESQFDENMNWDNHGRLKPGYYTWQIDHIRPRTDFEYTTLDDPQCQECWSLCNMRPLSAKENSLKGNGVG